MVELEMRGAASVTFVRVPGTGTEGLDDVLATRTGVGVATAAVFERLLRAAGKLPKQPKVARNEFFDAGGLRVDALNRAVRDREHVALDQAGRTLVYRNGVYVNGDQPVRHIVATLLGDLDRSMHMRSLSEVLVASLHDEALVVPAVTSDGLLNVRNGLLNPFTGELSTHTPDFLSITQLPIAWDPEAKCELFDQWLEFTSAGRANDLLEALGLVLDMRGDRQRKSVFLTGPTRSGKSTMVRLMEAIVGPGATKSITLNAMTSNRFALAGLYGKLLNTGSDQSAAHLEDAAIFRKLTGNDTITVEHKYGNSFEMRSRALFVFSGNETPTVGESSAAYIERWRPYVFPHSYAGVEDPAFEQEMIDQELPGILMRLVEGLRRFEARGAYVDDHVSRAAIAEFARKSDRVLLFLRETCDLVPEGFVARPRLFDAFQAWAMRNRRVALSSQRFYATLTDAHYRLSKRRGTYGFVGIALRPEDEWGSPGDDDQGARGQISPTPAS